jgi:hypothetical protein
MQGDFSFYRKGTGNILPAQYDAAAEVSEMPFEKSGDGRRRAEAFRDRLRPLRQTRPSAVSTESWTFGFVP